MKPDFFPLDEIAFLSKWANKIYAKENPAHRKAAQLIKDKLWEPTHYWADQLSRRIKGIQVKGKADWKESAGHSMFRFKHYTWYRLYLEEFYHRDLFFTLGVDALEKVLFIKIDYQRSSSKDLNEKQKEYLKARMPEYTEGPFWTSIPETIMNKKDWEALIKFSEKFIYDHKKLYGEVFRELSKLGKEKRVARLTWNKNGWVIPSGHEGKSHNEDSHEGVYGYGHEEWLFDVSKKIDGYHYGFLEPIRKQQDAYIGKFYDVWLYTIDGSTKKRYFVGEIKELEVIDRTEASRIKSIYVKNGWLAEMEAQIYDSGASSQGFSDYKDVDLFNIRYKPESLNIDESYTELPPDHELYNQSRYTFIHYKEEFDNLLIDSAFSFDDSEQNDSNNDDAKGPATKTHTRPAKPVQITYLHDRISKSLTKNLKNIYGKKNVRREHKAGYGGNRIDIVVRQNDKLVFYEIKTYPSARTSVREALGQILEYSCWPDKMNAHELIIVTQPTSSEKEIRDYVKHLNKSLGLPIYYKTYDWEKDILT